MTPPEIFDRNARRLRRGRTSGGGFFADAMIADVVERLDAAQKGFANALVVGAEPALIAALEHRKIAVTAADPSPKRAKGSAEEDRLQLESAQFDLVLAVGTLDTVSDLPGALLLLRRALKPGGLFLAAFAGAPTLVALRQAVVAADAIGGSSVARLHPQIDVRAAGDLLVRAGFAMPVADVATVDVSYPNLGKLIDDLREAGATNVLVDRHGVTRGWLAAATEAFAGLAGDDDGRTHETLSYIMLTGWAAT